MATCPKHHESRRERRLYRPLESFFTKTWRPSEIELMKQQFANCEPHGPRLERPANLLP